MRGTVWFRLAAGARVLEGDVIDVGEHAQFQFELTDGGSLNAQGPALMHVASLPPPDAKPPAIAEMVIARGWLKAAGKAARPLRIRIAMMTVTLADTVAVASCDARRAEVFVESGTANVALPRGKDAPRDVTAGEFVSRTEERAALVASRVPAAIPHGAPAPVSRSAAGAGQSLPRRAGNARQGRRRLAGRSRTVARRREPQGLRQAIHAEAVRPCLPCGCRCAPCRVSGMGSRAASRKVPPEGNERHQMKAVRGVRCVEECRR